MSNRLTTLTTSALPGVLPLSLLLFLQSGMRQIHCKAQIITTVRADVLIERTIHTKVLLERISNTKATIERTRTAKATISRVHKCEART